MKLIAILVVSVICFAIGFSAAQAAVIKVDPVISGILNPTTFGPLSVSFGPKLFIGAGSGPVVVQVDLHLSVESLEPWEDSFGATVFSVIATSHTGATVTPTLAYGPRSFPNVDSNGPIPGGLVPLFASNVDLADPDDYLGIQVAMATGGFTNPNDPRRNVGESNGVTLPTGEYLGSGIRFARAWFLWNGQGFGSITLEGSIPGTGPDVAAKEDMAGSYIRGTSVAVVPIFLAIPEPGTLALAGLSLIGLAFPRNG